MVERPDAPPCIQRSALHLYQLYDISDSIDLEIARTTITTPSARVRPVVSRGASIDIPQLPLEISMGTVPLTLNDFPLTGHLHARIYDLGIIAFRLIVPLPEPLEWEQAAMLLSEVLSYPPAVMDIFNHGLDELHTTLTPAIQRPNATIRQEDYTILIVERLAPGTPASRLARHPALLRTALGERKPLSETVQSLATSLSYYVDDLILLTWSAAIVIEPDAAARDDATLLLEFANVQLLAFRSYDDEVGRDLRRITPRIARGRRPVWVWLRLQSSSRFLREIYSLIADITDTSARVENALKVTEDVYWNRVYSAAITVLRVEAWRTGIAETLGVLRQTASLLRDEAQTAWASLLEVLVIVLIAVELVVALISIHH
ncbi:MAG TPA: hypothetical protein VF510_03400 [Ktedonobacterales bacterium]